jgi:hypothetical protein
VKPAKFNSRLCSTVSFRLQSFALFFHKHKTQTHSFVLYISYCEHFCSRIYIVVQLSTPAPVTSPPDPQVFHQTEGKNKGKGLHEEQHQQHAKYRCGCVIKVSDGPKGAIKRIYVGCPSKKAATDTRTSMLEAAACISQNLKTISKAPSLDCVIFPVV